jgi:hypothetical protein
MWTAPLLMAALAMTLAAGTATAHPGFYLGLGGAQQSISGDMNGKHIYTDPSGNPQFGDGKFSAGGAGGALEIGYGFGTHFALEYFDATTSHTAKNSALGTKGDAVFTSQMVGGKFIAPMSAHLESFLRAGYGIYDAQFTSISPNPLGLSKASFHGTGTAIGAGLEIIFTKLGIEFGYTQHNYAFDRAKPSGSRELGLHNNLTGTAATTDVMINWHF